MTNETIVTLGSVVEVGTLGTLEGPPWWVYAAMSISLLTVFGVYLYDKIRERIH